MRCESKERRRALASPYIALGEVKKDGGGMLTPPVAHRENRKRIVVNVAFI